MAGATIDWATAMYAGLRRGELQALRWSDVDLARGLIHVQRSWDVIEGLIEPKSAKGRRKVPIAVVLRDYLTEHKLRAEQATPDGLVFGQSPVSPFRPEDSPIGQTGRGAGGRPPTLTAGRVSHSAC